jgi:hypothetical protein
MYAPFIKDWEETRANKDVQPMTNADRIRAMSDEELAEWLADTWDCHDCSEHERLGDNPLLREEPCDQKCEQHCFEWLKQPAEGEN